MIKLHISYQIKGTNGLSPLDVELIENFVPECIFENGYEKDLEAKKTFISILISRQTHQNL